MVGMNGNRRTLRSRAEDKARERLRAIRGPTVFRDRPAGYTSQPQQNLIPGVVENDFWSDLIAGAGNELVDGARGPGKFCAAFSSSALAVNSFGPFRHHPERLELVGYSGFSEAQFEKPLPTGLSGIDPHLDFYCVGREALVCVESKFLETLWPKEAKFADSYESAVATLSEPMWDAVYQELKHQPDRFKYLDAAQLVKHYLGMRHTLADIMTPKVLLYAYWEPANADEIAAYGDHRDEVEQFRERVRGSQIKFMARPYQALWAEWSNPSSRAQLAVHISHLMQRYDYSI
jgi:hypothetical protein